MRPYTDTLPKALVPVDGETTILDIALHNFAAVGLTDVAVVVGYRADAVEERKVAMERRHGVSIRLVYNDKAEEWNNAYSLWTARECLRDGALLVNGDTVHPIGVERTLLDADHAPIRLALDTVKNLAEEEMKVVVDESGYVRTITKLMDPAAAAGEYIGATLIDGSVADDLADALEATWRRDPQLYYEDGYQELVNRGGKVATVSIGDVDWVEVDNHDDLARAREIACRY